MIIILYKSANWKRGRLRLYCFEVFPSVYVTPDNYNKKSEDKLIELLSSDMKSDEGIAIITNDTDGKIMYKSIGNGIPSRQIKYIDDIPYFSMKTNRKEK